MLQWELADEPRRNPVSPAVLEFVAARCGELRGEVVVLTGSGDRAFCSGFDLDRIADAEADHLPDAPLLRATAAMRTADATLVAALNGLVMGAGVELACACDLRVAVDTATFTIPAARLGVVYHAAGLASIRAAFGPALTARMLLAGDRITAAEALAAGALAHAVPRDVFPETVTTLVDALKAGAPQSLRGNRNLLRALDAPLLGEATLAAHEQARVRGLPKPRPRRSPRRRPSPPRPQVHRGLGTARAAAKPRTSPRSPGKQTRDRLPAFTGDSRVAAPARPASTAKPRTVPPLAGGSNQSTVESDQEHRTSPEGASAAGKPMPVTP